MSRAYQSVCEHMIEYVRRSTLNMTNLNAAYKRKGRSRLYHIVENSRPNGNWTLLSTLLPKGESSLTYHCTVFTIIVNTNQLPCFIIQLLGRMGSIEEMGKCCVYVAAEASFMTGIDLPLSGGAELNYGRKSK